MGIPILDKGLSVTNRVTKRKFPCYIYIKKLLIYLFSFTSQQIPCKN